MKVRNLKVSRTSAERQRPKCGKVHWNLWCHADTAAGVTVQNSTNGASLARYRVVEFAGTCIGLVKFSICKGGLNCIPRKQERRNLQRSNEKVWFKGVSTLPKPQFSAAFDSCYLSFLFFIVQIIIARRYAKPRVGLYPQWLAMGWMLKHIIDSVITAILQIQNMQKVICEVSAVYLIKISSQTY